MKVYNTTVLQNKTIFCDKYLIQKRLQGLIKGTIHRFNIGNRLQLRYTVYFTRFSLFRSMWPLRSILWCNGTDAVGARDVDPKCKIVEHSLQRDEVTSACEMPPLKSITTLKCHHSTVDANTKQKIYKSKKTRANCP